MKDSFFQDFSFSCSDTFIIKNQLIQRLDIRSIFVGSRKIIKKIPNGRDAILCKQVKIAWSGPEERFEFHTMIIKNKSAALTMQKSTENARSDSQESSKSQKITRKKF